MRRILLIAAFLSIAFGGYSTDVSIIRDTTRPVTEKAMQNALRASDSLQTMKHERDSLYRALDMYEALAVKDSQLIAAHKENIRLADLLISHLESSVKLYGMKDVNSQEIDKNNRAIIRKKNWQIFKKSAIAVTGVGLLILLLLKKK